MRVEYGKTWWGRKFLQSLDKIDYDNRLPRGRAYANRGAVRGIEWNDNQILAQVQGSARQPYKVRVLFPPFPEKNVKSFIEELSGQPVVISRLLAKDMDPMLLDIAMAHGMKLFPERWSDLKMQCSCPDWAVPCKHLAAVIFKTSAEIDNDPLLVFSLHALDLRQRLEERGHRVVAVTAPIPELKELYSPLRVAGSSKDRFSSMPVTKPFVIPPLPDLTEPILALLEPRPVFFEGSTDFRELYANQVRKAAVQAQRLLSGKTDPEFFLKRGRRRDGPMEWNEELRVILDEANDAEFRSSGRKISFYVLLADAFGWQPEDMRKRHASHALWHGGIFLSLQMLAKGAVVPQVVRLPSGRYRVRWLPATIHPEVREVVERLGSDIPKGFVCWKAEDRGVSPPSQVTASFVSVLLDKLMWTLSDTEGKGSIPAFFFQGASQSFDGPGETTVPESIQQWLYRLHADDIPFRLHILVTEEGRDRFELVLMFEDRRAPMEAPITLEDLFAKKEYGPVRYAVLQSVTRLRGFIPGLDGYLQSKGSQPLALDMGTLPDFLFRMVPAMQLMDVRVLLPKSLQILHRPSLSVRLKAKRDEPGFFSIREMLDFDWRVAVGDEMLDEKTFLKVVGQADGLIRLKSGYIYASHSDLELIRRRLRNPARPSAAELLTMALSERYGDAKVELAPQVGSMLKSLAECPPTDLPKGLQAKVRPYQQRGYAWMWRNLNIGFGSILADDMGLGKTLQVIAILQKLKEEGMLSKEKALVVAPTGLLTNWQSECMKFAPSLSLLLYHGPQRVLPRGGLPDLLITSYGVLRSDVEKLRRRKWRVMVIDEAQNIKNTGTAQTRAVKSVPAAHYIAMSGTPVENRLTELWSLMDYGNRGLLGSVEHFSERYGRPIQQFADPAAAERLKKVCAPFLLRRMKTDKSIITDLPEKFEVDCFARLTASQAALYRRTLDSALQAISSISGNGAGELFTRQGLVLQMILALKQICNHPTQFLKNGKKDPALSGKSELLFDRLDSILAAGEKALVFTQFTEMASLLSGFIQARYGKEPLYYHGGLALKPRKEMVARFQEDPSESILILSLRAGGTGLNLTAASHVIHYDLWWNPAVEAQATDRAYRIGQRRDVMVHRFITKDTFEERVNDMIKQKRALAEMTVGTGEQWIAQMSNDEIEDIFRLR